MNARTLIMVVVALLIVGVTIILVKNRSQSQPVSRILVATMDIPLGSFVRADKQMAWVPWPPNNIAPSFITPDSHKIEEFNGSVARRTIQAGEPITSLSVVRANEGGFMSAVLTPGKRAVSIAVNPTSGNAGFIFPDDKVDLILTHKIVANGAAEVLASETFVQNVRVLAVDQMVHNPDNKAMVAKTITLEVTPKQAEMINVATSLGNISVSLRSLGSDQVHKPNSSGDSIFPLTMGTTDNSYSTNTDVSRLMGDKTEARTKVSVYHGGTPEQLNFR